jgi:hypothetical protein
MREYFGDNVDIVTDENRYSPIEQAKSGQVASVRECHRGAWSRALENFLRQAAADPLKARKEMQAGLSSETSQNQGANPDEKVCNRYSARRSKEQPKYKIALGFGLTQNLLKRSLA